MDIETNIENIVCFGKTISQCNKQHLSKIKAQFIKKLCKTEAELKKSVAYKKKRVFNQTFKYTHH